MIALAVRRQAATPADAEAALAALDRQAGIYFGVDAGIAGLHPLQATLLSEPALALDLHGDGVGLRLLNGFGEALLGLPEPAAWRNSVRRGAGNRGNMLCRTRASDGFDPAEFRFSRHRDAELALLVAPGRQRPVGPVHIGLARTAAGLSVDIDNVGRIERLCLQRSARTEEQDQGQQSPISRHDDSVSTRMQREPA